MNVHLRFVAVSTAAGVLALIQKNQIWLFLPESWKKKQLQSADSREQMVSDERSQEKQSLLSQKAIIIWHKASRKLIIIMSKNQLLSGKVSACCVTWVVSSSFAVSLTS